MHGTVICFAETGSEFRILSKAWPERQERDIKTISSQIETSLNNEYNTLKDLEIVHDNCTFTFF